MSGYSVERDEEGYVRVVGHAPSLLGSFLEDIDLEWCEQVLQGLAELRAGRRVAYRCRFNSIQVTATAAGAWLRIAANLTHNPDVPLTLDALEDGLRRLRAVLLAPQ